MKLDDALAGVGYLGFDTAPIIYFIEGNPKYDALMIEIFQRVVDVRILGCTSAATVTEVCTKPAREGRYDLVQAYRDLLLFRFLFWRTSAITVLDAARAAELCARYNLRTLDALQLAVAINAGAINAGCEAFLTNDKQLRRVTEIRVLVLDDLER